MKRIAVLGSTGSIGTNCLDVVATLPETMQVVALTAHRSWELLAEQTRQFRPRWAVLGDATSERLVDRNRFAAETELLFGPEAIERVAAETEVDTVVAGIVGAAGLRSAWSALQAGKTVALANKETMVVAGALVSELVQSTGGRLLPVDSEHSAIFQALQAGRALDVRNVVLTSSGGPFRGRSPAQLESVTAQEALDHPTWQMGPKITVDSATMMNKALEIIEAKWLFDLQVGQIQVVVHPQSVVHSFVEFVDGSVIAQLSPPDMKLPIQYALTYPERVEGVSPRMNWADSFGLEFEPPDLDAFPCLMLGFEVAREGGTSGAVLNAVNEVAVERFLEGRIGFRDIFRACRAILDTHNFDPHPTLSELTALDAWAREETFRWCP